jgi:hypothetical protein
MSNVKEILPKSVWTDSGEKSANYLSLTNFKDYHFDDGPGVVMYSLIGPDGSDGLTPYFQGSITIPASVIQNWGASDDIIWDYVATELQITIL